MLMLMLMLMLMQYAGKARPGAGRRRRAGKHTPEDVQATLDAAMSLYGLHSFRLFWDQGLDIRALLSWSHDSAVLAFRGTASLTNACSDLKVGADLDKSALVLAALWLSFRHVCEDA